MALEYAHAYAHEYGGGRWQVQCEGLTDLRAAIATLAPALRVEFSDAVEKDVELQFQWIVAELHHLARSHEPHRCLLLLDNVDQPDLLDPGQTQTCPLPTGSTSSRRPDWASKNSSARGRTVPSWGSTSCPSPTPWR